MNREKKGSGVGGKLGPREGGRLASCIVGEHLRREQRRACERTEEASVLKTEETREGNEQELSSTGFTTVTILDTF